MKQSDKIDTYRNKTKNILMKPMRLESFVKNIPKLKSETTKTFYHKYHKARHDKVTLIIQYTYTLTHAFSSSVLLSFSLN